MVSGIITRMNLFKPIKRRIRNRLLLFILPLVYIPFLLSGIVILYAFEDSHISKVKNQLDRDSNDISISVEGFISENLTQNSALSKMPIIKQSFLKYRDAFFNHGPYSSQYQDIEDSFINAVTDIIELGSWHDLFFVDKSGSVVFSLLQGDYHAQNLYKFNEKDKMRSVFLNTKETLSSTTIYAGLVEQEEKQLIYFSSPIYIDGKFESIVVSSVDLDKVSRVLLNTEAIQSHTYLEIFLKDNDRSESILTFNDKTDWEYDFLSKKPVDLSQTPFTRTSLIPSLSSIALFKYDENHINEPLNTSKLIFSLIFISVAMMIFLASSKLARSFTQPIETLKFNFKKLAEGDENIDLKINRQDEIGTLFRNFNLMIKKLKSTKVKLVESRKLASIGSLSAGIAHEINNPLAIITSNTSTLSEYSNELSVLLAKDTPLEESELEDIRFISGDISNIVNESGNALDRVKDIVASMQVFSEIETAENENLGLREALLTIKENLMETLKLTPIIKISCPTNIEYYCKAKQLKMALSKVIENAFLAIKDSQKPVIKIAISQIKDRITINIMDNGNGIPKENLNRIFDPFFTTRPVGSGIGMGLTIAYTVIQAHNGEITVNSTQEKGTIVSITLPIQHLTMNTPTKIE